MVQRVTADYWSANKTRFFFRFFKHVLVVDGALLKVDLWRDLAQRNKKL